MTTLFIRLLPRALLSSDAGDADNSAPACAFAVVSDKGHIEQEGYQSLRELKPQVAQTQRVVLLLAASDVTTLHMAVPPLPAAKLKAALPNLIEDQLIVDPAGCVIAAGARIDGMRAIAVVQRDWLEHITNGLLAMGAKNIKALPSQLCLPLESALDGAATAAIVQRWWQQEIQQDVSARLSKQIGIGVSVSSHDQPQKEALAMLRILVPSGVINLYVAAEELAAYQQVVATDDVADIHLHADDWSHWIIGAQACDVNLMTGMNAAASEQPMNWEPWRWSLALATLVLLVNVVALNSDWWHMRSEAAQLKSGMLKDYRKAYPQDTVIVDPIAQAHQKIALSQQASGAAMPDDFIALAAQFNTALNSTGLNPQRNLVSSLEYRDRSLFVRFSNAAQSAGLDASGVEKLKVALTGNQLLLSQPPTDGVWQIKAAGANK